MMDLRYVLKVLFLPPGLFLLLLLAAWALRHRWPGLAGTGFWLALCGLWIMAMPLTVEWSARRLEPKTALAEEDWPGLSELADVIVVLGGGRSRGDLAWGDDQPSLLAMERLRYAARLARASKLPLLASGGPHFGLPPSEADLAAEVLQRDLGVRLDWREPRSRTTWENAVHTAALLRAKGLSRVVLVTTAHHMRRARWCFERNDLQVIAAPVGFLGAPNGRPFGGWLPEARALWQTGMLWREWVGGRFYPWLYP